MKTLIHYNLCSKGVPVFSNDENENVTSRSRIYQSIQAEGIEILRNSGIFCKAFTEKPVHVFAHEEENFT